MLTDTTVRQSKPKDKPYKLTDGGGLYLLINTTGKYWRLNYRFAGKQKTLALGVYPAVSLIDARQKRDQARSQLAKDIDPSESRKEQKLQKAIAANNSFEAVSRLWWGHWKHDKTERHANYTIRRMEADIFPSIGHKPVNELTAAQFIAVVREVETRGALDIAKRVLTMCGQVMRYAVAHGLAERNPTADIKPSDVLKPANKTNYARLSEKELPELLRKVNEYDGQLLTRFALQLMVLTFVRTSELIGARWDEFEVNKKEWRIPAQRMKMRNPHIVPLSSQAIAVLEGIQKLDADDILLFPSERRNGKSMSNNTILYALYRMGYHNRMTGHGFRGLASTILHEQGYKHDHIELQLAHTQRDPVSAAYNHALYLEPRARMMQDWADYLDELVAGAKVANFEHNQKKAF